MTPFDARRVPIVINNRNRLTTLRHLVARLEAAGAQRIIVLDNGSTYPPLLEYYRGLPHAVHLLGANLRYVALWETRLFDTVGRSFFVYTDPDVVPTEECPDDFLAVFHEALCRHPDLDKVGFALRVDDLPAHSSARERVRAYEARFWRDRIDARLFRAPIDTTFALYRPGRRGGWWLRAARTAPPYVARHLPWYVDPAVETEEERYYRAHAEQSTHWTEGLL